MWEIISSEKPKDQHGFTIGPPETKLNTNSLSWEGLDINIDAQILLNYLFPCSHLKEMLHLKNNTPRDQHGLTLGAENNFELCSYKE